MCARGGWSAGLSLLLMRPSKRDDLSARLAQLLWVEPRLVHEQPEHGGELRRGRGVGALGAVIAVPIVIFVFLEIYNYLQMRMIGSKQSNIILPSVPDIIFL